MRHEIPIGPRPQRGRTIARGVVLAIVTFAAGALVVAILAVSSTP